MTELLLVRHGETDWNAERRWQGHADVPLNDAGRVQAGRSPRSLPSAQIDVIYSSDLARARETAEIAARRLRLEVVVDSSLREIDVGSRQGRTWLEIDDGPAWDGESPSAHAERVVTALTRIAATHAGRVLVVTHGGSIRRVHEHLELESPALPNCAVWACMVEDGIIRPGGRT